MRRNFRLRRKITQLLPPAEDIVCRLAVDGRDDEPRVIRLCEVCLEECIIPRMALEDKCIAKHERRVCAACLRRLIEVAVRSANNPRCPSPVCGVNLSPRSIRLHGNREDADNFELQCTTRALDVDPDFRWCAHRCGAGHVHLGDDPLMKCPYCTRRTCYIHRTPWHEGFTCEDVDVFIGNSFSSGEFRRCPKCGHAIEKIGGCEQMICICGHAFCWRCTAPYSGPGGIGRYGHLAHREDCAHYRG